jgi:branched-chain amino acid transport system substrate-binding protein
MSKKGIIGIVILALVGFGVWYYLNGKTEVTDEKEIVKIGVILPLTGDAAPYGIKIKEGIDFAFKNSSEKTKKSIKLIYEDSQGKDVSAINSYTKLVNIDGAKIIIGPFNSSAVLALSKNVSKDNTFLMLPAATSPKITDAGDNIFRIISSDIYDSKVLSQYITKDKNQHKISIVYLNNEYGVGFVNAFKKSLEKESLTSVQDYALNDQLKDYKTIIAKIKESKTEAVVVIGINEIGFFLKQAKEMGLDKNIYSTGMIENPEVLKIAGVSANNVIYTYPSFDLKSKRQSVVSFVENFSNQTKEEPSILEALGYDSFMLLANAINEKGGSTKGIREYLLSLNDYDGVTGQLTFDNNGDVMKPIGIKEIINQEFTWLNSNYKINE